MKRVNNLTPLIVDPDNIRLAFWKAQRGKSYSIGVMTYRAEFNKELIALRESILSAKVVVGDYYFFTISDPKQREICVPAFREQVLHHALMNICHKYFDRKQIYESYASRKGKGTYAALDRARHNSTNNQYFLKLDVRKFFGSIHHDILNGQLVRMFKDQRLLSIFSQIIESYPAEDKRGLPIGNLTSQYFANHYLSGLDHFIKEALKVKAYVRYMDDMVLWADRKEDLKIWADEIQQFVINELGLVLKPILLNRISKGLPFLGYILFSHHIRLSQRSKQRFAQKMKQLQKELDAGLEEEKIIQRRLLPLVAFTRHADAKKFRKNVLLRLEGRSS